MEAANPAILINDDEVEFKVIYVYSTRLKKIKKYTITEAERLGLVQVESGSFKMGRDSYSKTITIKDNNVKLGLSTRVNRT